MSLRDNLDVAADVADILAYQQRAELLATQTAQLETLRDLRDQAQIQSLLAARENALQDTLFALRRSLPTIVSTAKEAPHKAATDVILAAQTLQLVPPEVFSTLEWKDLSVKVRDDLNAIVDDLQEKHGEPMTRELIELREAALAVALEERNHAAKTKRDYQDAVVRQSRQKKTRTNIAILIAIAGLLLYLFHLFSRS